MEILGYRTVYDVDPSKTFMVADVMLPGAILPVSIRCDEINPVEEAQAIERRINYDMTITPSDMPAIDFDNIEEVKF